MKVVILAWGEGEELWPLSTAEHPKQFLKLFGDKSLLEETLERVQWLVPNKDIFVSTNDRYEDLLEETLSEYEIWWTILEPARKHTAPAILLACKYLQTYTDITDDEAILFLPADHMIGPTPLFQSYIQKSLPFAEQGDIVLFGIAPRSPETVYGYIRINTDKEESIYYVADFVEKPDRATAEKYIDEGNYFWNSGILVSSLSTLLSEYKKHLPDFLAYLDKDYHIFLQHFKTIEATCFSMAITEKTTKAKVIPMILEWSDIWSWERVWELSPKDDAGNVIYGDVVLEKVKKSLVWNELHTPCSIKDCEHQVLVIGEEGCYCQMNNVVRSKQ